MNRRTILYAVFFALVGILGCSDQTATTPDPSERLVTSAPSGLEIVEGSIGAGYFALYRPDPWNGRLVLWAHGYRDPDAPITIDGVMSPSLRDALLDLGYGVAYSSYPANGYAIREGVNATRQLRGIFEENFGEPSSTYLLGASLGGIITVMQAERNTQLYAGALPMCSLLGGARLEIEYINNARVLFDYYYPEVIPGNAMNTPDHLSWGGHIVPAVLDAVLANPGPLVEMASVDQIELPYSNFNQLLNSLLTTLYFNVRAIPELLDRTSEHSFFDNTMTVYTGSSNDEALNAGVDRISSVPAGENYLDHWYQTDGDLGLPVITLHTTQDPAVPLFHEPAYAALVSEAGASDFLVQRTIDRYGHCTFTNEEILAAFLDLVNWAETGVRPTP